MHEIRTLIVDDDPAMCVRLKHTATRRGLAVETFYDARDALSAHLRQPYRLIIADWLMPEMDGLELCRRVRDLPHGDLPVILVVTARNQREDLRAILDAGANDYLAKPFDEAGLTTRLTIAERAVAEVREREKVLAETEALHARLQEVARHAGMAEIATSVLHNVGNVLNSVNVSAAIIAQKAQRSRVSHLRDAVALMQEHDDDLGQFITRDEKWKLLPAFLIQLAEVLKTENRTILEEISSLTENLEHIKDIVRTQQTYAGVSGVIKLCDPAKLMEDAVACVSRSFKTYGITVVRRYDPIPQVNLDRAKLLQILVNLVKNAKEALVEYESEDKVITLSIQNHDDDRFRLLVADNGPGVREENLAKIFSHGFTTKKDGHGFGLHGASNAAMEMGGTLSVASDGPGKGTTFTAELPLVQEMAMT